MTHHGRNLRRLAMGTVVCLGLVFAAWATPILPAGQRLPDELLCVRGIENVSIEILRMPMSLNTGSARRKVKHHFRQALENHGFRVDENVTTPRLKLQYWTAVDHNDPDSVALTTIIGVYQKVTVHRIEQDLVLPGASIVQTAIGPRSQLDDMLIQEVGRATVLLAQVVEATAAP